LKNCPFASVYTFPILTHVDKQLRVKMIPNIYVERELAPEATIRKLRIVQTERAMNSIAYPPLRRIR